MPSGFTKPRGQRLQDGEIANRPIRGAGIRIEHEGGKPARVFPVEQSLVLHVEQRRIDEGRRRRLSLVEWFGNEPAPAHASRHVADLFARDSQILDFAIAAMREKIERDKPRPVDFTCPVSFEVAAADVVTEGYNTVLALDCRDLASGSPFGLRIQLESDDYLAQNRGQLEFAKLCAVLGLREVEDAKVLVGRRAIVVETDDGGLAFGPLRFVRAD